MAKLRRAWELFRALSFSSAAGLSLALLLRDFYRYGYAMSLLGITLPFWTLAAVTAFYDYRAANTAAGDGSRETR